MTALGLIAGLLTTVCWIPQLTRSLRTRSTDDLSWTYLGVLGTGVALWLAYGVVLLDIAIVVSNLLTLGCIVTLLMVKAGPRKETTS